MISEHRVETALFRHLLDNSAIPLIGSAIGATLVASVQWRPDNHLALIGWLGLVYGVVVARLWLTRTCRARVSRTGYCRTEAVRFALTTGLSGAVWGGSGLQLTPGDPLALVVTLTGIHAMIMGGVLTLGTYLPAFYAFALAAMLPTIAILLLSDQTAYLSLAAFSAIFLVLMITIAHRFNGSLRKTWQLSFDKEDLLAALTDAHDRLAILADTDGLTGLTNRRRFDEAIDAEFNRLRRSRAPLSLLMMDVDHFKNFNDSYGHVAGDQCLIKIAGVFRDFLQRTPDFAARYGGEEFVGVLPETDLAGAIALAENIRAAVEQLNIDHRASETADHVTVSLGVVTVNCAEIESPSAAVKLVDEQLYRAKSEGRNRIAAG